MTIRLGDIAPNFTAETTEGSLSFHEWLGSSWGVLFSHPADFTPVCTTELGLTSKLKDEFAKRNTKVIALSVDPLTSHKEWVKDINETQNTIVSFPIIADPEYSEYLRLFGEIGSKAFSSSQDYDLYEAVRHLSIIKEFPNATAEEIAEAEHRLEEVSGNMGEISEMSRIRNLHWWTVEYGLIGTPDDCKIYGAGLLSSIGESVTCMQPEVKKIPYTVAAANTSFDITKQQPQLFVTPSFKHLVKVLEEFADTMALQTLQTPGKGA